jgi:hypothetical protein
MNPRRGRGRSGGGNSGNRRSQHSPNRSYDSNGPNVRIRGTATQVYDKYCALARDANSAGDRVSAENFLQHAEHYFRIINANGSGQQQKGQQQSQQQQSRDSNGNDDMDVPGSGPQPTVAEPAAQSMDDVAQASPETEPSGDLEKPKKPARSRNRRKAEVGANAGDSDDAKAAKEPGAEDSSTGTAEVEETSVAAD